MAVETITRTDTTEATKRLRRKMLFVSYQVPPRVGVGTRRSEQILKFLPEFGWDITVITGDFGGLAKDRGYVETPFTDVRATIKRWFKIKTSSAYETFGVEPPKYGAKLTPKQAVITAGFRAATYPDAFTGWIVHARRAVRNHLDTTRYDVLFSSAPPFSTNIAITLASPNVPWIADMRDPWSETDPIDDFPLRHQLDYLLEGWSMRKAAAFTAASDPMAQHFGERFRKPHYGITNAFDDEEWRNVPFSIASRCTFLYGGYLYRGRLDPSPLFEACRSLIGAGHISEQEVAFDFYCPPSPWLSEVVARYGMQALVRIRDLVPRNEIMRLERQADRLLLFLWDARGADAIIPGKLFEYLGARRPILACSGPPSAAVDDILQDARAGTRCLTQDILRREILRAVIEHRAGKVQTIPEQFGANYTARRMAANFDRVFRSTIAAPR